MIRLPVIGSVLLSLAAVGDRFLRSQLDERLCRLSNDLSGDDE